MRRIKLTVEYDGTSFNGWQRQEGLPTVQAHLEDAICKITREDSVRLHVAGRTDAGVHATGQVCHFDTTSDKPIIKFQDGVSYHSRPKVSVVSAEEVDENFHSRHSATMRHYKFLLFNRRSSAPTWHKRAVHIIEPLDISRMQAAIPHLLGEVDYSSFRTSECQSSTPMVYMDYITIAQEEELITIRLAANHFLHNMVRILVGTLVEIGSGRRQPEDIKQILAAKDRQKAGKTLPPYGLYLTKVDY